MVFMVELKQYINVIHIKRRDAITFHFVLKKIMFILTSDSLYSNKGIMILKPTLPRYSLCSKAGTISGTTPETGRSVMIIHKIIKDISRKCLQHAIVTNTNNDTKKKEEINTGSLTEVR